MSVHALDVTDPSGPSSWAPASSSSGTTSATSSFTPCGPSSSSSSPCREERGAGSLQAPRPSAASAQGDLGCELCVSVLANGVTESPGPSSRHPSPSTAVAATPLLSPIPAGFLHYIYAARALQTSHKLLHKTLIRDKRAYTLQLCRDANEAFLHHDQHRAYRVLRSLRPFQKQCLPILLDEAGNPLPSPDLVAQRWLRHYNQRHAGAETTALALHQDTLQFSHAVQEVPRDATCLPVHSEVTLAFAKVKARRAPGEDLLVPDLFKSCPDTCASLYWPLYLKAALLCREPTQWKGGFCAHFPKPAGNSQECTGNRSVVLENVPGKVYHQLLRRRALPVVETAARDSQMGAVSSRGCDFGGHFVRTVASIYAGLHLSAAFLFTDITDAFYSLVRQTVLRYPSNLGSIGDLVRDLHYPAELAPQLASLIGHDHPLDRVGISQHLNALLAGAHCGTWLSVQHSWLVSRFQRGALPGDPLADLMFVILAVRILGDIDVKFMEAGLDQTLPPLDHPARLCTNEDLEIKLPELSYIDDMVFFIVAPPEELVQSLSAATAIIYETFRSYHLEMNMKKGKTEAVVNFCGRGSRQFQRDLLILNNAQITFLTTAGERTLHCVPAYKHLGGIFSYKQRVLPDISQRVNNTWLAYASLKRGFFEDDAVLLVPKCAVAPLSLWSILLINIATLHTLSDRSLKKLNHVYMRILRRIADVKYDAGCPSISDSEVLAITHHIPIRPLIKFLRLAYFGRLAKRAPPLLLRLLDQEAVWLDGIAADLEWLDELTERRLGLPAVSQDFKAWAAAAASPAWAGTVSRARAAMLRGIQAAAIPATPAPAGPPSIASPASEVVARSPCFCYECGASFAAAAALAAHAWRAHGRRNPRAAGVHGTHCLACLREFHVRGRLMRHLCSVGACAAAVEAHVPPPPPELTACLIEDERKARRLHSRGRAFGPCSLPFVQLSGPLPRWAPGVQSEAGAVA